MVSHYNSWNFTCCHSVTNFCSTICHLMDRSRPGFPVPHHLLEFAEVDVLSVSDNIQPSLPLMPSSPSAFKLSQHSGSFLMSQLFASGGQSIGASAPASVLPMSIQDWFPLELTGLTSFLSKGCSGVFSSTTVWKQSALFMV